MKLVSLLLSTALLISWSFVARSDKTDDILNLLPAIIAASIHRCDLDKLSTCKTPIVCTRSGGYWYSGKCNIDPYGLMLIQRLTGTWDFYSLSGPDNQYTSHDVISFSANTIRPIGNNGDYKIKGRDITNGLADRDVFAIYHADNDIVYVEFSEGSTNFNGIDLILLPEYWFLGFTSSRALAGVKGITLSPYYPPDNPAWATKK